MWNDALDVSSEIQHNPFPFGTPQNFDKFNDIFLEYEANTNYEKLDLLR